MGKIKGRVQEDPALSQAELLRVLPAFVPIRLATETDTEEQMELIVDDSSRAEIKKPFRSPESENDNDVKRQRLGEQMEMSM